MFDRPPQSTPGTAIPTDDAAASVERLCRQYDSRLNENDGVLSPEDERELKAMAAIYDLDTDRSPAEVWRDLRAVVTRQAPLPNEDTPLTASTAPLTGVTWSSTPGQTGLGRGRSLHHEERLQGHHRAGLRHGGGPGPARAS